MKSCVSHSVEETQKFAKGWLHDISKTYINVDGAIVIGLSGHLGAGKTAFVKAVARELGVGEEITSPTFVIMKMYSVNHQRFHRLVHIDAYRLEKPEELEVLGFEDLVADPSNLIMVEWPEHVGLEKFDEALRLSFEMNGGVCTILSST